MIIKIRRGQPELRLSLVQPGRDALKLADEDLRLIISSPHCDHLLKSPLIFEGCWPGREHWRDNQPHDWPALCYPAWEVSDEGDVVFRFDELLFQRPPGRYIGQVEWRDGRPIARLDLDLDNSPYILDKITVITAPCNAA
jgi:hypothetical protein